MKDTSELIELEEIHIANNSASSFDLENGASDAPEEKGKNNEIEDGKPALSSILRASMEAFKYVYSTILVIFCVTMVTAAIFSKQTTATGEYNLHPVLAFAIFWILLLWLSLLEGGLNCMVGLAPIEKDLYKKTHPLSFRCTVAAHRGDNIERFIVGRQYMDLMIVFSTSFMVSTIDDAAVLGLPRFVNEVFLDSGLAVILITIVFGQLVTQINAAKCMLDFINNYVMLASTYAALTVEASGILHAVYLFQILSCRLAGNPVQSKEPPRSPLQKAFFWGRVLMSLSILMFAFAVAFKALFANQTTMWEGIPAYVSVIILFGLIVVVGMMEALQIAFMAVIHMPEDELSKHPRAQRTCAMIFQGTNLQAFLIGRQIFQTIIMFAIARIITVSTEEDENNIFRVGDRLQSFFNTGILGALISTIVASLSWRVVAAQFPLVFLSNPFGSFITWLCLAAEKTGVCYCAWSIAALLKMIAGYKEDETYVGTAADRASKGGDEVEQTTSVEESSHD
jgi:hypothetical protein